MQFLVKRDPNGDSEIFRFQATDDAETLSIITTPKPVGLPLSYQKTEVTIPMCGLGADYEHGDNMTWTVNNVYNISNFVDFANGVTLTQRINITAHIWSDGKVIDTDGGFGIVEVYHRL